MTDLTTIPVFDTALFKVQTIISADHQSITATDFPYGPGNKANT